MTPNMGSATANFQVVPLTTHLGEFVSSVRYASIPAAAMTCVRAGFADTVGVMIAGTAEPATKLLAQTLAPSGREATVLFGKSKASSAEAAWINATAAHALDYDDAALRGHPSAVLVPAILAEAQLLGSTGKEMLAAYVAGYEVWGELAHRDAHAHHRKGWHPTGLFGPLTAAAAVASLRKLDPVRCAHAIALAASQSSGLMSNFGSMAKPFHAGKAAHAGVFSTRLAEAGFTGSLDAIEHPQGFLSAVSPSGSVDRTSPIRAGRDWHILRNGLSVKKYPMCYCTHRLIDAALQLQRKHHLAADQVEAVTVTISGRNATVLRNHSPRTGLAAKFSAEFAMAAAFVQERVTLTELTDDFVQRADIQSFFGKVKVEINPNEDPDSGYAPFDTVEVVLANGELIKGEPVGYARGANEVPLSSEELYEKFSGCLAAVGSQLPSDELFGRLMQVDELTGTADIPGLE